LGLVKLKLKDSKVETKAVTTTVVKADTPNTNMRVKTIDDW